MSIKATLGNYSADELQKYLSKELEERALKDRKAYKEFIEFIASFRSSRYSPRNQFLLFVQATEQELLPVFGTYDEWKNKGTSIKGGEKGLTICKPIIGDVYYEKVDEDSKEVKHKYYKWKCSKEFIAQLEQRIAAGDKNVQKTQEVTGFTYIDSVFSMSQTTMQEEDRIEYLQRYNAKNTSEENAELYGKLVAIASALGRHVEERDIKDESLGWVERTGDKTVLKKGMPTDSKCSVLSHEIGHTLLHIKNDVAEGHAQKEVQAQLFSHLAMLKLGIDAEQQFSLHYINSYLNAGAKSAPMFDAEGKELSPGQVLQLNISTVLPAVDLLVQTVGDKAQPIDADSLKKLQEFSVDRPREAKPTKEKPVEHKIEIEPLRVYKQTDKAVLVKLSGANASDKKVTWLPRSQISTNKDGFVYEATPSLIKDKGLTPKAAMTAKISLGRRV